MNWVIEKGWAYYWGTSEWSADQLKEVRRANSEVWRFLLPLPVCAHPLLKNFRVHS